MAAIIYPINPHFVTQIFGANPQNYAQFGLKGHNGWDIRTKHPDTLDGKRAILASWMIDKIKQGIDPPGYGNYFDCIVKLKKTWKLTFAHCDSIQDFKIKSEGEQMAVSDNTGNSTAPHLHLTVKPGTWNGSVFTHENYNNGYFGAVDPKLFFDELLLYKQELESGTIPPMDQDTQKALKNLQEYRKVRAQGPGGSFEGLINEIIGNDKDIAILRKDLDNANEELKKLKVQVQESTTTITELREKIKQLESNPSPAPPILTNPVAQFFYKLAQFAQG